MLITNFMLTWLVFPSVFTRVFIFIFFKQAPEVVTQDRGGAESGLRDSSVRGDVAVAVKRDAELPAARVCISMAAIIRK